MELEEEEEKKKKGNGEQRPRHLIAFPRVRGEILEPLFILKNMWIDLITTYTHPSSLNLLKYNQQWWQMK